MNRRSLFIGLIAVVLVSLLVSGIAEPANPADRVPRQKESAQQDLAGYDEVPMFIVIPRDQGNSTSIISFNGAKQPLIGTALRDTDSGPIGIVFHQWMGFALKDNESISLRISVESVRPVDPTSIIKLLASNMTLDEIRDDIRMQEGNVTNRGVMRLGNNTYRLVDIRMPSTGNTTVLDANVSQPPTVSYHNITIIGHITVALAREGTAQVSQGVLNMSEGKYDGNYRMLLDAENAEPHEHRMGNAEPPMMPHGR